MKPSGISADVLFEDHRESLRWQWVAGLGASSAGLMTFAVRAARSGADLVGYLNYIHPYRVQGHRRRGGCLSRQIDGGRLHPAAFAPHRHAGAAGAHCGRRAVVPMPWFPCASVRTFRCSPRMNPPPL